MNHSSTTMQDRIAVAAETAQDAFWDSIATSFPDVTTGDFSPLSTERFERECADAVQEWVVLNHPDYQTSDDE